MESLPEGWSLESLKIGFVESGGVIKGKGCHKIPQMRVQNESFSALEDKPQEGEGW